MATYRAYITWDDDGYSQHRPEEVEVTVSTYSTHTLLLNEGNGWEATYSVSYGSTTPQWTIPDIPNYTKHSETSQSGSNNNRTYTNHITYTYDGPTTTRVVGKAVFYGDEGFEHYRPESITVRLMRNGYFHESKVINAAGLWSCTWEDLDANYTWALEIDTPENYQLRLSQSGNTTTFGLYFVKPVNKEYEVRIIFPEESNQYRQPREVTINLFKDGQLERTEVFNKLNGFHLFYIELSPNSTWTFEQEPIKDFKTEKQVLNNIVNFINTWVGEEPNPQIGDHPTDSDYDLKYSVLYDAPTAEVALDIIHVLDYGNHDPDVKPIP